MSDQWLSSLNTLLQWVAVVGIVFGLASTVGRIFTSKELSRRQSEEVGRVKKYAYVSTLTFNGMLYTGGDIKMPTQISPSVEDTWQQVEPGGSFRPVCDTAAIERNRAAIQQFPDFPFPYYALSVCLRASGDPAWREYAEKAVAIFEQTTQITGHHKSHEEALARLREQLAHIKK